MICVARKKLGSDQYRHGDLLLVRVDKVPRGAKKTNNRILAMGEATNHAHRLDGGRVCVYENPNFGSQPPTTYVEIVDPATLVHVDLTTEEKADHNPIDLPIGIYMVVRQEESDPFTARLRMVRD